MEHEPQNAGFALKDLFQGLLLSWWELPRAVGQRGLGLVSPNFPAPKAPGIRLGNQHLPASPADNQLRVWMSKYGWSADESGQVFICSQEESIKPKNIVEKIDFDSKWPGAADTGETWCPQSSAGCAKHQAERSFLGWELSARFHCLIQVTSPGESVRDAG